MDRLPESPSGPGGSRNKEDRLMCQPWVPRALSEAFAHCYKAALLCFHLHHLFMVVVNGSSICISLSLILNEEMVSVCKNTFLFKPKNK